MDDPRNALQPSLENVPEWEVEHGERNAFRVRGTAWFKRVVERDTDKLRPLIAKMEVVRVARTDWAIEPFDWAAPFALAQVYQAANRKPLRFDKAAKVILLFEVAGAERGIPSAIVRQNVRIEPAFFGIADFTESELAKAQNAHEGLLTKLVATTGQQSRDVFHQMAAGKGVSYRLAWKTREALVAHAPSIGWRPLIIVPTNGKNNVSDKERVDGPSVPDGAPYLFVP